MGIKKREADNWACFFLSSAIVLFVSSSLDCVLAQTPVTIKFKAQETAKINESMPIHKHVINAGFFIWVG